MSERVSIKVRNRDIPRLRRILPLMQEVAALERRRGWQMERMEFITQRLSDMPRSGEPRGLDAAFADLMETDERQEEGVRRYLRELREVERIINGIESAEMRCFVLLFYVEDLSPRKVKAELNMTERGFRNARQAVEEAESMDRVKWLEKFVLLSSRKGDEDGKL